LIVKIFLLIFIIFGNLIVFYYKNEFKASEFLKNYNKNKIFEFSQSISISKAFEILRAHQFNFLLKKKVNLDYENINFSIIRRNSCGFCGLFSNYIVYLGCIRKYLIEGFVPILEFESYKNAMNGFMVDPSKGNPWEYYFNQPFGYKYSDIKKKAKNIKYFDCKSNIIRPTKTIFINKQSMNYWHIMANQYIPIKNEIIIESKKIIKKLFNGSRNILGILLRGTDYVARKPRYHSIPPKAEDAIKDVKLLDKKNKYDWIFLATEDNIIRQKFINSIGSKVILFLNKKKILYNYATKKLLAYCIDSKSIIKFNEIYLLNIIILSNCLDLLAANTSGTIGIFVLTKGFRNYKVYNLGNYK
jgi:hypothetical protein